MMGMKALSGFKKPTSSVILHVENRVPLYYTRFEFPAINGRHVPKKNLRTHVCLQLGYFITRLSQNEKMNSTKWEFLIDSSWALEDLN